MDPAITLASVKRALDAQDPAVVELLRKLILQRTREPEQPTREGTVTYATLFQELRTPAFRRTSKSEQESWRRGWIRSIERDDAEVPLPDWLRSHEVITALWNADDAWSRRTLLAVIRTVPLAYGPWKALKRIFKEAEEQNDTQVYGALVARFDEAASNPNHEPTSATLAYLTRRGWRYLRRLGENFPAVYPDVCTDVLRWYSDSTNWRRTWVANHIFYHETGDYGRGRFRFQRAPSSMLKHRAFAEAWRRTPRPLFSLLEVANSDHIRKFATTALRTDFRTTLREVEPEWVIRLIALANPIIDEFATWLLKNVPRFEQSEFREMQLHEPVIRMTQSQSSAAAEFAADYIRTHARDIDIEQLVRMADSEHKVVRELTRTLLAERDPRKDVGLVNWGHLLDSRLSEFASRVLCETFTDSELTPDWFAERLLNGGNDAFRMASSQLTKFHSIQELGIEWYSELLGLAERNESDNTNQIAGLVRMTLSEFDLNEVSVDPLKQLLLNDKTRWALVKAVNQGLLRANRLPMPFLKAFAFHPAWEQSEDVIEYRKQHPNSVLDFDETTAASVLEWLKDVREFSPSDIGFEWLMTLVQRGEQLYHSFAVDTLTKIFLPADFAEQADAEPDQSSSDSEGEITVDLDGASFLFTGKLATMTRAEAKKKVSTAGGANSSTVSGKLNFLVIGDEGSPLYGEGRKGSKQVKAEKLREEGADLKIISETAFLQMLSGEQREFSDDAIERGCETLWSMMMDNPADHPLSRFARQYMRLHHPEICLAETDRPVDPGAEIPPSFLNFERIQPLFHDDRKPIRDFAMELAKWEFVRWSPTIEGVISLCESPHPEVRTFVALALTAEDIPEHRRYRLDPAILTVEAVYSFCESRDRATRELGMTLIGNNPELREPEELFNLTESPDRFVRAFAVRGLWALYRERGITRSWEPQPPAVQPTMGKKAKERAAAATESLGSGAPARPNELPASHAEMQTLLRRALFELPPGPPEKETGPRIESTLPPLSARRSKLNLIETLRDAAMEDVELAEVVLPLFEEFSFSRGKSEREACLVAVTRIRNRPIPAHYS